MRGFCHSGAIACYIAFEGITWAIPHTHTHTHIYAHLKLSGVMLIIFLTLRKGPLKGQVGVRFLMFLER